MTVEAVVFDWGGTLTPFSDVDLLDLWRAAARVLAPERAEELASALAAAERAWWDTAVRTGRSGTTADVVHAAAQSTGVAVGAAQTVKPHAAAFRAVLDALDVTDPAAVVFVGDRPHDDIFGAKQMGMRAVLLPNEHVPAYAVEPDATIQTLAQVLPLVDAWR